jgi:ketosteroid isomerase-like protein
MSTPNLELALSFVRAVEQGATGDTLTRFLHPDISAREYPNRLFPSGMTRDLRAMTESAARGQQVLSSQRYQIRQAMADGDTVALEIDWSGTVAIPLGSMPAGGTLRAAIAQFLTFRDGRIVSIRNYDCYEPF